MKFVDLFGAQTESSYQCVAPIYQNVAPLEIHHATQFGPLHVVLQDADTVSIDYGNQHARVSLKNAQAVAVIDESHTPSEMLYLKERIILPFMRLLRGAVLFHGSAVSTSHGTVVFLADTGVGKSTMASLCLSHHSSVQLVSDDLLSIVFDSSQSVALPSASHLAMRHDTFDQSHFVTQISTMPFKHMLTVNAKHTASEGRPIRKFVLLEKSDTPSCRRSNLASEISNLLKYQCVLSHAPQALTRFQFQSVMQILKSAPIYRCQINFLRDMSDVVSALLSDNVGG